MSNKEKKEKFDKLVDQAKNIIITSHLGVDDDAVCSCLATYAYLIDNFKDKNIRIMITGGENNAWNDLIFAEKVEWVGDLSDHLKGVDLVIFLDGNQTHRFSYGSDEIDLTSFNSICIDHHKDENDSFSEYLGDRKAMATCEILAEILFPNNVGLDRDIAKILLIGIIGDSGCFKYVGPETSNVFQVAQRLVDFSKIAIQSLTSRFEKIAHKELKIVSLMINNLVNLNPEGLPGFSYSYLPKSVFNEFTEKEVDEGYHHFMRLFLRHIEDYVWGFVVTPRKEKDFFKISFRALPGGANVRLLANMFEGGGHDLASGGKYIPKRGEEIDSDEVCEKILEIIKSSKLKLTPVDD